MDRPLTSEELKEKFKHLRNIPMPTKNKGKIMTWINHLGDKFVTVDI